MDRVQWRTSLDGWSAEWVAGHDPESDGPLDDGVAGEVWLGHAPATDAQVAAAEVRLGCDLPLSLREFLLVTNGWRNVGLFIYRLAGASELSWLKDTDESYWIDAWTHTSGPDGSVNDEARILARSLRLSTDGDAAIMLLDPADVNADGEWAAYWLASWSGMGPERYESFFDLVREQWDGYRVLRPPADA